MKNFKVGNFDSRSSPEERSLKTPKYCRRFADELRRNKEASQSVALLEEDGKIKTNK